MTHAQLHEVSAAFALGALDEREQHEVEAHFARCEDCRAEVSAQREVVALLALAAPPVDMDRVRTLRRRILEEAVRVRPAMVTRRPFVSLQRGTRRWNTGVAWLAAASTLIAVVTGGGWLTTRRDERKLAAALARSEQSLAARDSVLANFFGPMVHVVSLSQHENDQPQARVYWNHTKRTFIITAFNLPPAPRGKTYQL